MMKKIVKIFPVFILVIMSLLTFFIWDMKEKELYKSIQGYHSVGFVIPDNKENITQENITQLFQVVKDNHILLVKTVYNEKDDTIDNYMTTDDILAVMGKQLKIDGTNVKRLTTYKDSHSFYYPDFLDNDRYAFYSTNLMKENDIYPYGSYFLYYEDEASYLNFRQQLPNILNVSLDELNQDILGQLEEPIDIFYMVAFVCISFFILLYFILVVFLFYRDAKRMGVLSLLGFSNKDILRLSLKNQLLILIMTSLILLVLAYFCVPNISLDVLKVLIGIYLFIFMLTILISYLALLFLQKYFSLANILKKQSIIRKISNLCLLGKLMMIASMIIMTINALPLIKESVEARNYLKDNEILMDYALFSHIRVENGEYDDYDKFLMFYKKLEESDIDYIYADFRNYLDTDEEVIKNYEMLEPSGKAYRIASIDVHYLNKYDLICFDESSNQVNMQDFSQEAYLLPYSKKSYTSGLKSYIQNKYQRYQLNEPVLIYYYEDQTFDTFDSEKGINKVKSPILRVIHANNPFTYFENNYGLDLAGTGMNTALRFKVENHQQFYRQELYNYIQSCGLENVLVEDNFVCYRDYYNDLITSLHHTNTIFISSIVIFLAIYILMLGQTFVLFIDARKKEIMVKSLLGFKRKHIFKNVILWNIVATMIPIICILLYVIVFLANDLFLVMAVSLGFLIMDLVILMIMERTIKLDKVYQGLKGE